MFCGSWTGLLELDRLMVSEEGEEEVAAAGEVSNEDEYGVEAHALTRRRCRGVNTPAMFFLHIL